MPCLVVRFQNSENSISGPNVAPNPAHAKDDTVFCLKLYTEKGLAYAREFDCSQVQELAFPVEKRMYYRLEITNESDGCLVALSNPIWLEETHES